MLAALLLALVQTQAVPDCAPGDAERSAYREMSYDEFDQTPGEGWRAFGESTQCRAAAGDLIIDYLLYSKAQLSGYNVRILRFHAGQVFAFAGESERALAFFRASYGDAYSEGDRLDWNSYLDATIAFMEQDRATLEAAHARLLQQTPFENGMIPNLNIADGFLACYGEGYSKAYSEACTSDGRAH